ncbi:MAG: hypothetical protein JXR73_21070 [Candidatus Omnitrophica bacterium]|nr:hypothetical protein [Candidatus Omnitrophota bacterium]
MGGAALSTIREAVLNQGIIPVELHVEYRVVYSTLQGNMPVNDKIHGSILGFPVNLRLEYTTMPNTYGSFPVNNRFMGMIGDTPVQGKMGYQMIYSTIAGNFPVNTGLDILCDGVKYHLDMPTQYALGRARGGGSGMGGGGGGKVKKVVAPKFKAGKMIEVDETAGGDSGISFEVHRPICAGIQGVIADIMVDLHFSYTYYTNTSSGRNPVNNFLSGCLRSAA